MKLDQLHPGDTVYDVHRQKMGNTNMWTVGVWPVKIVDVIPTTGVVIASWNGNQPKTYFSRSWSKWRRKQPILVRNHLGMGYRFATREERRELKNETP